MGARGRGGNFRGRGSRGRGRGGRGKSFGRFGPSRRFDTGRLKDEDEERYVCMLSTDNAMSYWQLRSGHD